LRNDPNGTTIRTLKAIYSELATIFPDAEMFLGADETAAQGKCTIEDYRGIESAMSEFISEDLNRTVGGWEELGFTTHVATSSPKFVLNTWHYKTQAEATALGFHTVAANDSHLYLVYQQPWQKYWFDMSSGLNSTQRSLLRGGVVSAWTDEYCYISFCIHEGKYPAAHALFPPSADPLFHRSILAYSFPRAAVAAGSFWHYNASMNDTSPELAQSVRRMNDRIIRRGLPSCPNDCKCDAARFCGAPYANESHGEISDGAKVHVP
jgi:hypothetical protein